MSAILRPNVPPSRKQVQPRVEPAAISLTIAAVASVIMLQATRVFVSYLVVVIGQANRTSLATVTFGVFLAIALAPLIVRLLGTRSTIMFAASGMALLRVVIQFWTRSEARLIMAAAVIILWGWLALTVLGTHRHALTIGLLAGLLLDVALRVGFLTLDLPWNSGVLAAAVTIALAGFLLVAAILASTAKTNEPATDGGGLSLIAVGPGLALFHLVSGNLGLAQTKTGLGFAAAMLLLSLGLIAGMLGSLLSERGAVSSNIRVNLTLRLAASVIGGAALWVFWTSRTIAPFALPFVSASTVMLTGSAILSGVRPVPKARLFFPTLWFTLGMLLQVGILFLYYDASGQAVFIVAAATLLAAGALIGVIGTTRAEHPVVFSVQTVAPIATTVAILILVCGWQFMGESSPTQGSLLPVTFTVMTYNLQDGFSADNSFDLEAQADTIASAHPDVVVLQEVSRGWLVTSAADEALWLSHRLNMPIYFGGNSDDGLWGNAILTRAPVAEVRRLQFTVTKNLKRGAIEVRIPTANGDVWIVGTHLDNPKAADAIRLEQATQLLHDLSSRTPAIVAGDFNADPGTAVLNAFSAGGFADPGAEFLRGVSTTTDERRLDYVLITSRITVTSMRAIDSQASDHKPVIALLSLAP